MKFKKVGVLLVCIILSFVTLKAQNSTDIRTRSFDSDWYFKHDTISAGSGKLSYDASNWRKIDLPHDWSAEDIPIQKNDTAIGPFYRDSPTRKYDGYTYGGTGWYRKFFRLTADEVGKKVFIQFDGVYMDSKVWINGHYLGNHPNGYTPFYYELTPYLNPEDQENLIVVKVKNEGKNSRWYAGSGIYRHVNLTVVNPLHIDIWGINITTPTVSEKLASINVATTIVNDNDEDASLVLQTKIVNPEGKIVGETKRQINIQAHDKTKIEQQIILKNPLLWSAETPILYAANVDVLHESKEVDKVSVPFGIREIKIDAENGLLVNGKSVLLKGGCIHHDNGPLGAISIERAEERKIELLKKNGFNAIRISHNPPSELLLEVCDRIGMYVIDEAFDVWRQRKWGMITINILTNIGIKI